MLELGMSNFSYNKIQVHVRDDTEGENIVPHSCPVCKFSLRDYDDVMSYSSWECCTDCSRKFAEPNREEWKKGKRPSSEQIEEFRRYLSTIPSYLLSY